MLVDTARGHILRLVDSDLGELWEWDGAAWTRLPRPATVPPARSSSAATYDSVRGRVVLVSGQEMRDTWEWDGTRWIEMHPTGTLPPARIGHKLAFDPTRGRVVMFGGMDTQIRGDTWEYDGASWTEVTPATASPTARWWVAMAYDPALRKVVLFGGADAGLTTQDDLWTWDGHAWTELRPFTARPGPRSISALVYDPIGRQLLLFGGADNDAQDDLWSLRFDHPLGREQSCLSGVDTDSDALVGCADPDCWGRCAPSCPPGVSRPATAPGCGDGACNPSLETCRLCPGDCGACPVGCGDFSCDPGETAASCPGDCS